MGKKKNDPLMLRMRALFEKTGMTLDELGLKMGYTGDSARKSAWQLLSKTHDHRISMLQKFADAVGVRVAELFAENP
jgi:transcriptional regulator with XRE-family HTH domain